jgi:hypothetical protein
MKSRIFALAIMTASAALGTLPGCSIKKLGKAEVTVTADLDGPSMIPPVNPSSLGSATATLLVSSDRKKIDYVIAYQNLSYDPSGIVVYIGASGTNGTLALNFQDFEGGVSFPNTGGQISGTVTEADIETTSGTTLSFDDIVTQIIDGNAYIVISTLGYPSGEIRGQLSR